MTAKNVNKSVLVIIDGWGVSEEKKGNAIAQASTPFYDQLLKTCPHTLLQASSGYVGLPLGVMGNSEVGHMNIGAGRVVAQDLVRINESFAEQTFVEITEFQSMIKRQKKTGCKLHLLGLLSDGCVHSSQEHYLKIIELLKVQGVDMSKVFFHAILDGRDTDPRSAQIYLKNLKITLDHWGGRLASILGRFYAMDRDQRWERTAKAVQVLLGKAQAKQCTDAFSALEASYAQGISDEFFEPCVVTDNKNVIGQIESHDQVLCFNFRSDRMRQICKALTQKDIQSQCLEENHKGLHIVSDIVTMTRYEKNFNFPVLFAEHDVDMCLGEVIECKGLQQFRVAETEKYAHVTFFLNGGREKPYEHERRTLVPSPKVKTYDEVPAMHSHLVTDHVCSAMQKQEEHLIVVNFAQPDMVGHTGNFDAAIEAVQATDECLKRIGDVALSQGYQVFITADHGNIEQMLTASGQVHTAHTVNPVPLILFGEKLQHVEFKNNGSLSNIAPTMLETMKIDIPVQMSSKSLLK